MCENTLCISKKALTILYLLQGFITFNLKMFFCNYNKAISVINIIQLSRKKKLIRIEYERMCSLA